MQIKTAVRYHLRLVRMSIIKNLYIINAREGVEKKEPSYRCEYELAQPLMENSTEIL